MRYLITCSRCIYSELTENEWSETRKFTDRKNATKYGTKIPLISLHNGMKMVYFISFANNVNIYFMHTLRCFYFEWIFWCKYENTENWRMNIVMRVKKMPNRKKKILWIQVFSIRLNVSVSLNRIIVCVNNWILLVVKMQIIQNC